MGSTSTVHFAVSMSALAADNATPAMCDRVTIESIRNHCVRHFPRLTRCQTAKYREILERRAKANGIGIPAAGRLQSPAFQGLRPRIVGDEGPYEPDLRRGQVHSAAGDVGEIILRWSATTSIRPATRRAAEAESDLCAPAVSDCVPRLFHGQTARRNVDMYPVRSSDQGRTVALESGDNSMSMNSKKIAAEVMIAVALCLSVLGLGAGSAQADPGRGPDIPWIPGPGDWVPDRDQGINWGAPGQLKKWCPWQSPPGHWIGGPRGIRCSG